MDPRAIMQAKEIKAARFKDKSVTKSEVPLHEGDWQCQRTDRVAMPQYLKGIEGLQGVAQTAIKLMYICSG